LQHSVSVVESVCGPLSASLERQLALCFSARVVQGYALTECMPVTCPPPHGGLSKPGSVRCTSQLQNSSTN
jgi:hypothetical protein